MFIIGYSPYLLRALADKDFFFLGLFLLTDFCPGSRAFSSSLV